MIICKSNEEWCKVIKDCLDKSRETFLSTGVGTKMSVDRTNIYINGDVYATKSY